MHTRARANRFDGSLQLLSHHLIIPSLVHMDFLHVHESENDEVEHMLHVRIDL